MKKVLTVFLFTFLLFVTGFLIAGEVRMNTREKDIFKQELDPFADDPDTTINLRIWNHFSYKDNSEYQWPRGLSTGGSACDTEHANETQGLAHIHEIDENGKIIPEYWVLMKNHFVDVSEIDSNHFFETYNKENVLHKGGDSKFFDGDFYYPGYFGIKKALVFPSKEAVFFSGKEDVYTNHTFYTVSDRVDIDGSSSIDFNDQNEWSYLAIFPKTGMIFKPLGSISRIEGNNLIKGPNKELLARRTRSVKLSTLDYSEGELSVSPNDESLDTRSWIQGGVFSPNGRFFYNVHDADQDESDYTGVYIYYIPDKEYIKLLNAKEWKANDPLDLEFYLIGFIHIAESMVGCGLATRDMELEGIDIFPASRNETEYDIHVLVLNNECQCKSDEQYAIYHYQSGDYDDDGIKDVYDNCPFDRNEDQRDWNGDGIGDACQDYDSDGVMDVDDNCDDVPNPDQKNWNGGFGDACQDSDKDGWYDYEDACPDLVNKVKCSDNCRESDSECCLNARLICDMDGDGRWDLEPDTEYGIDEYAYGVSGQWLKEGGVNVEIEKTTSNTFGGTWTGTQEIGHKLSIKQSSSYFCAQKDSAGSRLSTYYCYCGKNSLAHFECSDEGDCGTDHANPNKAWDERVILSENGQSTWQPVFSEFNKIDTGKKENCYKKGVFKKIQEYTRDDEWDYQNDRFLSSQIFADGYEIPYAETEDEKNYIINITREYPMLKLAEGAVTGKDSEYITTTDTSGHEVNKNYFSNNHQDHVTGENDRLILAEKDTELVDIIIEKVGYFRGIILPGYGNWWYDMMRDYIGKKPWDDPTWDYGFEDIVKNSMYESIMRPSEFSEVQFDGENINLKEVTFRDNYDQIFDFGGRNAVYYPDNGEYMIGFADVNGIFNNIETVSDGIGMRSAAVTRIGTEIFMACGFKDTNTRSSVESGNAGSVEQMPERTSDFAKISFSENGAWMTVLSPLPWEPVHVSLFEANGRVNAVMTDGNGSGEIVTYYSENNYWEKLTEFNFGHEISLNNTFVKDNTLYFTAPGENDLNTLYTWNLESGIKKIASLESAYNASIKPLISDETVILADLSDISGSSISAWKLSDEGFKPVSVQLEKPEYESAFCINETNGSIFPGATNYKGECISVYDYNYDTVSYFDYKKTVAGYKNNLYLGGLTGVRRVKINEDGTLKNSDMLYTGDTNNLAVYGSTMYGANGGEVDIYSISEEGSISRIKGISSSSCGNVRVSSDRLFTAENKKVRIFDLTDPQNPELIQTISTAGKVIDLEVKGSKLYIYEEKTSWLTTKGYTGIYDITDLNSPVRTKYFEKRCTDAEMQKSGESVYLGCKNGQNKITDTGLETVSGEKNFVREGFVYDKVLYQVFSGALHKSKVSGLQAECGNGMIDPGEVCDSDTIQCTDLDSSFIGGTASCNSTCSGYNEGNCEEDGW